MTVQVFPVAPEAKPTFQQRFTDDHRGTDIFAPAGSPVLAVDDGRVTRGTDPKGGIVLELNADDGTRYFYAHLSGFPQGPQLVRGKVRAGDVIGFVGTTGNAAGKPPHLHFEVHPGGARGPASAVDPFPLLVDVAPKGSALKTPQRGSQGDGRGLAVLAVLYLLSRRA